MVINLAFLGTGYIADIHARAAARLPSVCLAAAVNPGAASLLAFADRFNIPRRYASLDDLLQAGNVDALVIGAPNAFHAPAARAALQAGVAVLVEKPMALNAEEAQAMMAASQKSGAALMVAHCWRFDAEANWLRQQVAAGKIGRIVRTTGYGVHTLWGPAGWFNRQALAGGGAMVDMGVHALDTARYLLGDPQPVSVYARLGTYYCDAEVDDTGLALVEWDCGTLSYIEAGWWQPHADGPEAATRLYGTLGYGSLFPTGLELPRPASQQVQSIDPGFPYPHSERCIQDMYDRQMAYFIECVQNGQSPVPGGMEGYINMKILDAAYQSSRTGKAIKL